MDGSGYPSDNSDKGRKAEPLESGVVDSPRFRPNLVESADPRSLTPDRTSDPDIVFFEEEDNDEYAWVRIPKRRDFNLFKVAKYSPEDRDAAELPLVATRYEDKKQVTLWAKLDTGAGANIINRSTVNALLGSSSTYLLRAPTLKEMEFALVGDHHFNATQCVDLTFQAGLSKRTFERVRFYVVPDDWEDPNGDGVPNVVLGWQFLRENHMVMIDVEYHLDADPRLEVISRKAEDEKPGQAALLPVIYSNVRGASRPVRPVR